VATTAASNGSVNAMIEGLAPASILVATVNIMIGEVVFGGVGAGMYGMVLFVILTKFLAGLMVGRTPEYLGKKIETREMRWTMAALLAPNLVILIGTALAAAGCGNALASVFNPGPRGFSELLYAFTSAAGNNGSALAGLSADTPFFDCMLAIAMLIGRFGVIVPVLAIAGSMSWKTPAGTGEGTFRAEGFLFAIVLTVTILIVGALAFVPALLPGPVVEQLLLARGIRF
jgi:potassium-transporting ATPase potassium-binding subunit